VASQFGKQKRASRQQRIKEEEEKISKTSFNSLVSALNSQFSFSRVHRREHVLLELAHHVPGLKVVAHVQVGAAVESGAELGAAAEAARALPEHLRGVARLF
jgi:hypothetical protein